MWTGALDLGTLRAGRGGWGKVEKGESNPGVTMGVVPHREWESTAHPSLLFYVYLRSIVPYNYMSPGNLGDLPAGWFLVCVHQERPGELSRDMQFSGLLLGIFN